VPCSGKDRYEAGKTRGYIVKEGAYKVVEKYLYPICCLDKCTIAIFV
jgi:hypothetical protein